jgi:hypothetical protein
MSVIGGSVTHGQGATTAPGCVHRLFEWIHQTYPVTQSLPGTGAEGKEVQRKNHTLQNAALSGTKCVRVCLSVCLSIHLSVCLSVCLGPCACVCLSWHHKRR